MQSNQSAEAFSSINHKLSQLPKTRTQGSIYRVHKELRDVNNNAYEPKLIAIGPYHHGKDNLKMMEDLKVHYLQSLLKRKQMNAERYISAINELEQDARDCYAEPISLNGAQFVEMLVLDGCFIIELARKYCSNGGPTNVNDHIFQTQGMIGNMRKDLLLFENQIPFFVLCKLFDLIEGENKHDVLMSGLLYFCGDAGVFPPRSEMSSGWSSEGIKHLLDLFYSSWVSSSDDTLFCTESESSIESNFIPSATELEDANVEFKSKEGKTLFEVNFENGTMKMPQLRIDDDTEYFLRNLIAYEQYFLSNERNIVGDYVIFLDCLINSSKDVKILSDCKIIHNYLGSKEAVANIINKLAVSICFGEDFVYSGMFVKVNRYYKKRWNRWMAMLRTKIFYSPWAYLSFFAALAILILTIVQTVCSILQVV